MFADLSDKLGSVFKKLRGEARLTEKNMLQATKDVRMALLEADVNYKVAKDFIARVEARAIGAEVLASVTPTQQFIKIVHDELIETLGGKDYVAKLSLSPNPPTIIMLCGLQGSGKTTTAGKLAKYFYKLGKTVTLVACDIYRPAAIDQLEIVGKKAGASIYLDRDSKDAVKIAKAGLDYGKKCASDVIIFDTAGRLHIDETLMDEVAKIKSTVTPNEIFFVADAMTGQDAVNSASAFDKKLDISGIILTKTDGDARGGAALSVKAVTGKPLVFVGTGEKLEAFELFQPERIAKNILDMGDIVSLVEKAEEAFAGEDTEAMAKKVKKQGLDFEDMLKQFNMMKKLGSISSLMKMIPGMGGLTKQLGDVSMEDKRIKRVEAVILSMTLKERRKPDLINSSRKKRIAKGSGTSVQDVNKLLDQLTQMNKMVKKMSKMSDGKSKSEIMQNMGRFIK